MQNLYPTANLQVESTVANLHRRGLTISKTSSRMPPVSPIHRTKLTPKQQESYLTISSSTNTGHHSKWHQPALKSKQPEISHDSYYVIDRFHFKSFLSGMLISMILMVILS